jgi:hypothetical protein
MQPLNNRRKRRRRPTLTPRFGPSSPALELGLLRLTLEMYKELEKKDDKSQGK